MKDLKLVSYLPKGAVVTIPSLYVNGNDNKYYSIGSLRERTAMGEGYWLYKIDRQGRYTDSREFITVKQLLANSTLIELSECDINAIWGERLNTVKIKDLRVGDKFRFPENHPSYHYGRPYLIINFSFKNITVFEDLSNLVAVLDLSTYEVKGFNKECEVEQDTDNIPV